METVKDFIFYKQQLIAYHQRMKNSDDLLRSFNLATDQQELRKIIENLNKTFPKQPKPVDSYVMCFAYANVHSDYVKDDDKKEWWKHSKTFIDSCPKDERFFDYIYCVLSRLPEMEATSGQKFNYALRAVNLLEKKYPHYQECCKQVEKIARMDYEVLLEKAKNETDYQKQIRLFDRALARITDIPASDRYRVFNDCMGVMEPVYNKTQWGRLEFPRKRRLASNHIFKSLPSNVQTIIRNRKNAKDWLYK